MLNLEDYETFIGIIETGSLTKAAIRGGRSLQAVSRSLGLVEKDVGISLILRTTRKLRPTLAGLAFYERIKQALAEIKLARLDAAESGVEIAGSLRIGASTLFAPAYIVPAVAAFMERYPGVDVDLAVSDDFQDPVQDRLDLTVRIGAIADSAMMARRVGGLRRVAFAAPAYLAQHGRPNEPRDLKNHICVIRPVSQTAFRWRFRNGSQEESVEVKGRFTSANAAACNTAVAAGLGIGIAPLWQIYSLLEAGRVELLLTAYEPLPTPVHLVWAPAAIIPARTRTMIEFLAARLGTCRELMD